MVFMHSVFISLLALYVEFSVNTQWFQVSFFGCPASYFGEIKHYVYFLLTLFRIMQDRFSAAAIRTTGLCW